MIERRWCCIEHIERDKQYKIDYEFDGKKSSTCLKASNRGSAEMLLRIALGKGTKILNVKEDEK